MPWHVLTLWDFCCFSSLTRWFSTKLQHQSVTDPDVWHLKLQEHFFLQAHIPEVFVQFLQLLMNMFASLPVYSWFLTFRKTSGGLGRYCCWADGADKKPPPSAHCDFQQTKHWDSASSDELLRADTHTLDYVPPRTLTEPYLVCGSL